MKGRAVRMGGFDPGTARRIAMTVSCPDADEIPKVADAGACRDQVGGRVQIMHNGLVVGEGGYYGEWMTETIRALRGHHEPQEELVFDRIVDRLRSGADAPVMIEFGSFWTYYGLWFCHALPSSRVVALEPDAPYLEIGRRNAALNGFTDRITFFHAAIGREPGRVFAFRAESDGLLHDVVQHDLPSLMLAADLERVDLVLCDAQGAETVLLERAKDYLRDGRVRFLIVSTHHHSISGNALTHQNALALLMESGAHVISEHTVAESFSGDGLIAVSFDARDKDFVVPVSYARSKDSLFGEVEVDLAAASARGIEAEQGRIEAEARLTQLRTELADLESDRDALRAHLDAITGTKLGRWAKGSRTVYGRIRGS